MERHWVSVDSRIRVTEKMIRNVGAQDVLELGAGDYSFQYLRQEGTWCKADFALPCDVICDFGAQDVSLPFGDASFDLVICTEVLEHLLWPQNLLREVVRVLRPNGSLIASVPNIASLSYRVAWLMGRIPSCAASGNLPPELGSSTYRLADGSLIGGHVIDFNKNRFDQLLIFSGFAVKRMAGCGIFWHRQIIHHWLLPASLSSNLICLAQRS
jgi:SAM-dependent methyltransferase